MEDRDSASKFIRRLTRTMQDRANLIEHGDRLPPLNQTEDGQSAAQRHYGDAWKLLYGISRGMSLMEGSRRVKYDESSGSSNGFLSMNADVEWSGVDHREWEEHYDIYGSGPYGRGLEIGRELATYTDDDFTFVENVDEEFDEYEFTFVE